jgi:A/G-specific adenine glycosylase
MDARIEQAILAGRRKPAKPARGTAPEARDLIAWYDRERRDLPWRAARGAPAEPYRVWLSEIMLQQTRVEVVARYYGRFLARFPTLATLAAAKLDDVLKAWAGLGYYARARNLHACARALADRHGGRIPVTESELRALPGIGAYTAAAIAAIAFGRKATPIDGNVERVVARLYAVERKLPAAKTELYRLADGLMPDRRCGDFAQAMMDLGATLCRPRNPACGRCPWSGACAAFRRGDPESFPRRPPRRVGKLRRGAAFFALRADGAVLLRRRPLEGLLGGMSEVPTTEWSSHFDEKKALAYAPQFRPSPSAHLRRAPPSPRKRGEGGKRRSREPGEGVIKIRWRRLPGAVRHVFTHFPLELAVYAAALPQRARAPTGMRFVKLAALDREALPSLMRKVMRHAIDWKTRRSEIA